MKYYYGNDYDEAVENEPVEIKTEIEMEQYRQMYKYVLTEEEMDEWEEEIDERNDEFWNSVIDEYEQEDDEGHRWVDEDDWEDAAEAIVEFNDGDLDESLADAGLVHWVSGHENGSYVPEEVTEVITTLCESWN